MPKILPFTAVRCLATRPFHTCYCRCLAVSLLFSCDDDDDDDDGMTFLEFLLGKSVMSLRYDWPGLRWRMATIKQDMDIILTRVCKSTRVERSGKSPVTFFPYA